MFYSNPRSKKLVDFLSIELTDEEVDRLKALCESDDLYLSARLQIGLTDEEANRIKALCESEDLYLSARLS